MPGSHGEIEAAAAKLHRWGVPNVLITLGEKGVYVSSAGAALAMPYRAEVDRLLASGV